MADDQQANLEPDLDEKLDDDEPVRLQQEFRNFDFLSPWEGIDKILPGDEKADPAGEPHGEGG